MTKSLTEKWKDGELFGFYYVKEPKEKPTIHNVSCMDYLLDKNGVEVLGPVPDYMDCKGLIYDSINLQDARKRIDKLVSKTEQLEKQLAIATKALEKYADKDKWEHCSPDWRDAEEALKEIKEVK